MFRRCSLLFITLTLVACSKKEPAEKAPSSPPPPPIADAAATGSATAGSGSAAGPDSAGSAAAGSGSAVSGSAASGSGSAAGTAVADPGFDFDKLSHDEQVKFMKTKVMPVMKPAFQKFDPTEYATFGCKTCHGKEPQKSKYKMPSPDLPALDFEALKAGKHKEMADFMAKFVKPEMAKLLNQHDMTQAEPTGFGCLECHTQKKKS